MANTLKTTLPSLITEIQNRSQENALASYTTAELVRHMNRATQNLRRKHDFSETKISATVSFTPSSTLPYAVVALSSFSSTAIDLWVPSYMNNANEEYKFWWLEPEALRELVRGDNYGYEDVEHAIAIEGANLLIYHNVAETLTFKYYSKYLVATVTTGTPKETWASNGSDGDWFIPENEELLIKETLVILADKEPDKDGKRDRLKKDVDYELALEKTNNPSQRMERLEPLRFAG